MSVKAEWWRKHKDLYDSLCNFLEENIKEIMHGELTKQDINGYFKKIAKDDFGIDIDNEMLRFLDMKDADRLICNHKQKRI